MAEEVKQDIAQDNQSKMVENKSESPSGDGLLQEVMAKKATIKERDARIAELEAAEENRRTKKLEDDGKLEELITELKSTNEKQASRIERADRIETQLKTDIINSITSDEAKREELQTKDLDTLRFIQSEIGANAVNNPTESLGAARVPKGKFDLNKMTEEEKRDNWPEVIQSFMRK